MLKVNGRKATTVASILAMPALILAAAGVTCVIIPVVLLLVPALLYEAAFGDTM
jgi:hypothetical protein